MRLLRSRNGRVALELESGLIVKFICIGATGPRFDRAEKKSFFGEYNTILPVEGFNAAVSFLACAKRAYRHSQEVCEYLWENVLTQNFSEMSAQELLACYNKLAIEVGKKKRAKFSSKAEAIAALEKLDALMKEPTTTQKETAMNQKVDAEGNPIEEAEKKPRGKGIGARAMELILEGKTNAEVIEIVKAEIEGANPTPATCAWYRNKLRQEGKLPPSTRGQNKAAKEAGESEEKAA